MGVLIRMKYYSREVTKREPINRFGKLGFVLYKEMVKTFDIALSIANMYELFEYDWIKRMSDFYMHEVLNK